MGETVNGTGCAQWADGCCQWQIPGLRAKNCGSYFVYFLKPAPTCSLAYCASMINFKTSAKAMYKYYQCSKYSIYTNTHFYTVRAHTLTHTNTQANTDTHTHTDTHIHAHKNTHRHTNTFI